MNFFFQWPRVHGIFVVVFHLTFHQMYFMLQHGLYNDYIMMCYYTLCPTVFKLFSILYFYHQKSYGIRMHEHFHGF